MAANRRVLKLFKNTPPRSTSSNHSISPRPQHHVRCCSTAHNPCRSILPLGQRSQLVNWRGAATSSGVTSVVATSPAVRTLLATHKLDAGLITPTGPKNRLLKGYDSFHPLPPSLPPSPPPQHTHTRVCFRLIYAALNVCVINMLIGHRL